MAHKVKLGWRIALTPLALLMLPIFALIGGMKGVSEWCLALSEFWRGE